MRFCKERINNGEKIAYPPEYEVTRMVDIISQCLEHDPEERNISIVDLHEEKVLDSIIMEYLGGDKKSATMDFWSRFNDKVEENYKDAVHIRCLF